MKSLLTVIPKTVPQAKRALDALGRDVDAAKTYEAIRKIERAADAIKLLFSEIEGIRHQAEEVVVLANHRIGTEINSVPAAKGGRPAKKNPRTQKAGSLREQVGSRTRGSRLKKLASIAKPKVKRIITKLHEEGKEATVSAVLKQVADETKTERRDTRERKLAEKILKLPDKRYGVIVADPQWGRTVYSRDTGMDRHAANHYPVAQGDEVTQDDTIKALDVASIAADDSVLGLWCTEPWRGEAVARAWGFAPVAYFVWCKDIIVREPADNGMLRSGQLLEVVGAAGLGFWNRDRDEIMLICVRGKPVCPAPGTQGESVWFARRGEHAAKRDEMHSDKPECSLAWFERHWPNVPKIELNRRGPARPGWDAWGNEVIEPAEAAE